MCNLGILYYNAQGVKRDLVQAYAWFKRAADAGDPRGRQLVGVAASKMPPEQIRKGQETAVAWHPAQPAGSQTADRLFAPRQTASVTPKPAVPPAPAPSGQPQDVWNGVPRIVAVGDVHGDFEQFVLVLESAGLIDGNGNWVGGKTHLVQTGDIVDRGPDSRKVMDLLMKLQKQAAAAGGCVHALIGNHEAMDVYGDLRYVSPGEFGAFRTESSAATQQFSYSQYRQSVKEIATPDPDARWKAEHPPGFAELRAAFGASGKYGKWIREHNAVIKIDDTLFIHAGLGPTYVGWSLERINQEVRAELNDFDKLHGGIVTDEQGPLWYRGLADGPASEVEPVVDRILNEYGVKRIVIGHTYAKAAITPRFGGKVILIDIGLSRIYDNIGKLGCLLIENGEAYALHRGQKLVLPKDSGAGMLRYLREAAALDPKPSPLLPRIAELEAKLARSSAAVVK